MFEHFVPLLAQIAFFPFAIVVFGRMERAKATAFVVLSGLLFLPDITLFQIGEHIQITKDRIIYLGALLGMLLHKNQDLIRSRPILSLAAVLGPLMIGNIFTWQTNLENVFSQGALQIGMSFTWLLGQTVDDFFVFGLPFVIAKAAFISYRDLRTLLYVLVCMGIVYTGFILVEFVLAIPFRVFQFQHRIYGILGQPEFRYGFTEPMVFFGSGHKLANFMMVVAIAAAGFSKIGKTVFWAGIKKARLITACGLLATVKIGAIVLGFGGALVFAIFKPRKIALIAALFAIAICIYPVTQVYDLFPEDALVELAEQFTNERRARSFAGRFIEEEFILAGIGENFYFGYATFVRIPGADIAGLEFSGQGGLDAWWVIKLGHSGIVGLQIALLILIIPIFKASKRIASIQSNEVIILMCALMLCILVRLADLMLNGWWNSFPVFLAGALYAISTNAHRLQDRETNLDGEPQSKSSQQHIDGTRID